MHLVTLRQEDQVQNDDKKPKSGILNPRQFIDLGLASANENMVDTSDEPSLSSSGSPPNNEEGGGVFDHDKKEAVRREDSPDQGFGSNKVPKFNSGLKTNVDQTEATMRKARVSVRARSEAPMVRIFHPMKLNFELEFILN